MTINQLEKSIVDAVHRVSRSATILLNDKIESVFPLFGPVREMEWADGWEPQILYGENKVDNEMIFRTRSQFKDEPFYTWVLCDYDPIKKTIRYMVSAINRFWFITVRCKAVDKKTQATVTYSYTAFNEDASKKNQEGCKKIFHDGLLDWERAINHYLSTGDKLIE